MSRTAAREAAMKIEFSRALGGGADYHQILDFAESPKKSADKDEQFVALLIGGIEAHRELIDSKIEAHLIDWRKQNMPLADLCILRVCVFEMLYCDETPDNICINEAIELAKRYGGDKSAPFINGVLGAISAAKSAGSDSVQTSEGERE